MWPQHNRHLDADAVAGSHPVHLLPGEDTSHISYAVQKLALMPKGCYQPQAIVMPWLHAAEVLPGQHLTLL